MRFPDQGSLQWCLGGAAPPGPCAQALGRLRSSSDSCPLLSSVLPLPLPMSVWSILSPCPACLPFLQTAGWPCPLRLQLRRDCYSIDKETQAGRAGRVGRG